MGETVGGGVGSRGTLGKDSGEMSFDGESTFGPAAYEQGPWGSEVLHLTLYKDLRY